MVVPSEKRRDAVTGYGSRSCRDKYILNFINFDEQLGRGQDL